MFNIFFSLCFSQFKPSIFQLMIHFLVGLKRWRPGRQRSVTNLPLHLILNAFPKKNIHTERERYYELSIVRKQRQNPYQFHSMDVKEDKKNETILVLQFNYNFSWWFYRSFFFLVSFREKSNQ